MMMASIKEIEPMILKQMIDKGEVTLIDVREISEYEEGHLPNANLYPTSSFDPADIPDPLNQKLVFYCASGKRSFNAATKWLAGSGKEEAYNLKGGIIAWKTAGYPIVSDPADLLNLQNKAYLFIGVLVLVLSILSGFSEVFVWLNILVGVGLIYVSKNEKGKVYFGMLLSWVFSKKPEI
jgi:rhodanese-related sulfurtransferase